MTKARKEELAKRNLEAQGYRAFFPHYKQWTKPKKTKPRLITKPYLTRYLFVGFENPNQSIYTVNNTIGVSTVVYCGYEALSIPAGIIDQIRDKTDEFGEMKPDETKEIPKFQGKVGDKIKFAETSPLFGFLAEIKRVDITGRLVVELDQMFGSKRTVQCGRADVLEITEA